MRKFVPLALGVVSLGAIAAAEAQPTSCGGMYDMCMGVASDALTMGGNARKESSRCTTKFVQCLHDGSWLNQAPKGTYTKDNAGSIGGPPAGKKSNVASTPVLQYSVGTNANGTPKLADTAPGNGKYTTVAMPDGSTVQVEQGIPGGAYIVQNGKAVSFEKVIDGVRYNVFSSGHDGLNLPDDNRAECWLTARRAGRLAPKSVGVSAIHIGHIPFGSSDISWPSRLLDLRQPQSHHVR